MEAKLKDRRQAEATVEVTVPAAEVDKAFDRVVRQLSRQVKVPGFRPGKAPRGVIVKRLGQEAIEGEVREELVERSYADAVKRFELAPVHAHVHGGTPSQGQDFTFELHMDLYPEVALPDLQEIVIDTEARAVDDEMVTSTVDRLRSENATMIPVDRPVQAGDYVLVESVGENDDDSGSTMPIDLEAVSDELAEQLVGRSAGEVVTLRLARPGGEQSGGEEGAAAPEEGEAEEAGAEGTTDEDERAAAQDDAAASEANAEEGSTLRVRIKDVKEKEKPEADDEFAKTLGFETWSETEERIRESLQSQLEQEAFEEQREEFVEKLIASTDFELPRSLVQRRKSDLLENLADDLRRRGMTLEKYLETLEEKDGRAEFERELQEAAEKGVRRDLVLERLLEQRGTRLSDAEFEGALRQLASQQGMDVERLRRERGDDWLRNYRFLLTRDRALRDALQERLGGQEDGDQPAPGEVASGIPAAGDAASAGEAPQAGDPETSQDHTSEEQSGT